MTWDEFLTDYENKIASTVIALDNGTELDPEILKPFVAPEGMGPLPEEYVDRTVEMLRQSALIGKRLEGAMSAIQRELGESTRTSSSARARSPFTDTATPRYFDSGI